MSRQAVFELFDNMSRSMSSVDRRSSQDNVFEAEQFTERPSLKRTTARRMGRVGIHNFRDVTQPRLVQVLVE